MRDRVQKKRASALERARKEEMVLRLHDDRRIREEVTFGYGMVYGTAYGTGYATGYDTRYAPRYTVRYTPWCTVQHRDFFDVKRGRFCVVLLDVKLLDVQRVRTRYSLAVPAMTMLPFPASAQSFCFFWRIIPGPLL